MVLKSSYDYPVVTNNIKVLPSTYEVLAKHPNIVGAKLATTDISFHSQICSNPNIE
jgi:2-keto-3-deoxy-L-rhamnonate aldolase